MTHTSAAPAQRAETIAGGLEDLARFVRANTHFADYILRGIERILVPVNTDANPRETLAEFAREGARAGLSVDKEFDNDAFAGVNILFGPFHLYVYAHRDQVCQRVVVGTQKVTRTVPDPEALKQVPEIEVTETEEIIEWRCSPLLAAAGGEQR